MRRRSACEAVAKNAGVLNDRPYAPEKLKGDCREQLFGLARSHDSPLLRA